MKCQQILVNWKRMLHFMLLLIASLFLVSCSSSPVPKSSMDNICEIFAHDSDWREAAEKSYRKWGTPPWTLLAIVYQESTFQHNARPDMDYFLFIPTGRPTSAYGYAQAVDGTWEEYKRKTGNSWADRDDIYDALDFIGWYNHQSAVRSKVSKRNAYQIYLAYHEGHGGYNRRTYTKKPWLMRTARVVQKRAVKFMKQYQTCR